MNEQELQEALEMEIWKAVLGYEGKYWVSNKGRVKSSRKVLKPSLNSKGYPIVSLYGQRKHGKTYRVHTLVLSAFSGPNSGNLVARHLDGDKTNNAASNLKWGTAKENESDKKNHGTYGIGENNSFSKLNQEDVAFIKRNYKRYCQKYGSGGLSKMFGVDVSTINLIVLNKTWAHVPAANVSTRIAEIIGD